MANDKKKIDLLKWAEIADAWRVVPRTIMALYAWGVFWVLRWYFEYEIQYTNECNSATLDVLLREGVPLERAQAIACSVADVIGHPTSYTTLVSVFVGAAAVVFGMYANSGRKWDKSNSMIDYDTKAALAKKDDKDDFKI